MNHKIKKHFTKKTKIYELPLLPTSIYEVIIYKAEIEIEYT